MNTFDWDDVRYFLAVARSGSLRGASEQLHVTHTTVLRRIGQLEGRLGARLFEKLPSGYRLTAVGEEVQELAEQIEASTRQLETRVFGRDQGVGGLLRVAMAPTLATHLLMPDLAQFGRAHLEIEMEILSSEATVNLTNREADVALRVVRDRNALPPNLHGLQGPVIKSAVYAARDLYEEWLAERSRPVRWVIKGNAPLPEWAREHDVVEAPVPFRAPEAGAHFAAVCQGVGLGVLPCFVGDYSDGLVRVPGSRVGPHGTLWLLTHGETRRTKRVRLFLDFISSRLSGHAQRLAGEVQEQDSAPSSRVAVAAE